MLSVLVFHTNKTLWAGWVVEAPEQKTFFAGDRAILKTLKTLVNALEVWTSP